MLSQSLKNEMSLTVVIRASLVVLSTMEMVLYEIKMKVDWYLLYHCLKLTSVCMSV